MPSPRSEFKIGAAVAASKLMSPPSPKADGISMFPDSDMEPAGSNNMDESLDDDMEEDEEELQASCIFILLSLNNLCVLPFERKL